MKILIFILTQIIVNFAHFYDHNYIQKSVTDPGTVDSVGDLIGYMNGKFGISYINLTDKKPYVAFYDQNGNIQLNPQKVSETTDSNEYIVTRSCKIESDRMMILYATLNNSIKAVIIDTDGGVIARQDLPYNSKEIQVLQCQQVSGNKVLIAYREETTTVNNDLFIIAYDLTVSGEQTLTPYQLNESTEGDHKYLRFTTLKSENQDKIIAIYNKIGNTNQGLYMVQLYKETGQIIAGTTRHIVAAEVLHNQIGIEALPEGGFIILYHLLGEVSTELYFINYDKNLEITEPLCNEKANTVQLVPTELGKMWNIQVEVLGNIAYYSYINFAGKKLKVQKIWIPDCMIHNAYDEQINDLDEKELNSSQITFSSIPNFGNQAAVIVYSSYQALQFRFYKVNLAEMPRKCFISETPIYSSKNAILHNAIKVPGYKTGDTGIYLNGKNAFAEFGPQTFGGQMTISFFVNWFETYDAGPVFDFGNSQVGDNISFGISSKNLQRTVKGVLANGNKEDVVQITTQESQVLPKNKWQNIIITISENRELKMYLDGVETIIDLSKSTYTSAAFPPVLRQFTYLGKSLDPTRNLFYGEIDEFFVYEGILDGNQRQCLVDTCNPLCATCEDNSTNCLTCVDETLSAPGCNQCKPGFYRDVDLNCSPCGEGCAECTNTECTTCFTNRDFSGTDQNICLCNNEKYIDHKTETHEFNLWCTSCTDVVVSVIQFNSNYSAFEIEFPVLIQVIGHEGSIDVFSNTMCVDVINATFINKLGTNPECKVDSTEQKLIVQLDRDYTLTVGDDILLNSGIIQRKNRDPPTCASTSDSFANFYKTKIQGNPIPSQPIVTIEYPSDVVPVSGIIRIEVVSEQNDGLKDIRYSWSLLESNSTAALQERIKELLITKTTNSDKLLVFEPDFLEIDCYYKIELQYKNHYNTQGLKEIEIKTVGNVGEIVVQVEGIEAESDVLSFNNWEINDIVAFVSYSDGTEKEFDIKWELVGGSDGYLDAKVSTLKKHSLTILKHIYSPGDYQIKLKVFLTENADIQAEKIINIRFESTPLTVYIKGGNRQSAYQNSLVLEGVLKDMDVEESLSETDIDITWTCFNKIQNQICKDEMGVDLVIPKEKIITFAEGTFEPYSNYEFTLTGVKGSQEQSSQVTIIITEAQQRYLDVVFQDSLFIKGVNSNDFIDMKIQTEKEKGQFSMQIIYQHSVVAEVGFQQKNFQFKIWDYFNDFDISDSQITLKIAMFDDENIGTLQSSFIFEVNHAPHSGSLVVNQLSGNAVETVFNIDVQNYLDDDLPLQYRYSYYSSVKDYEKEKLLGSNSLIEYNNIYQDFSSNNQIDMIFPRVEMNKENNIHEILLMVSVLDKKGAISNTTQVIEVNPPSSDIQSQVQSIKAKLDSLSTKETLEQMQILNVLALDISKIVNNNCTENLCSNNGKCIIEEKEAVCECNERFYLSDCSLQNQDVYSEYLNVKKSIFDKLNTLIPTVFNSIYKDQLKKSVNILIEQADFLQSFTPAEIKNELSNNDNFIQEQESVVDDLLEKGLLDQGDPKTVKIVKQVKKSIGNAFSSLDAIFNGISSQNLKNGQKRLLTEEESQNSQDIYALNQKSGNLLQKISQTNAEPELYDGKSIRNEISKKSASEAEKDIFGSKSSDNKHQTFQGFDVGEKNSSSELNSGFSEELSEDVSIQKSAFRNNPFQQEQGFPYKNQSSQMYDFSVKKNNNDENLGINKPIYMEFQIREDTKISANICVQRDLSKWSDQNCKVKEKESDDGTKYQECECTSLSPTSIINDIDNIFSNSKVEEVFSDEGLSALQSFKFWEAYIFYVYIVKSIILFYCIKIGFSKDKEEYIEFVQKEKEKDERKKSIAQRKTITFDLNSSGDGSSSSSASSPKSSTSISKKNQIKFDEKKNTFSQYHKYQQQQQRQEQQQVEKVELEVEVEDIEKSKSSSVYVGQMSQKKGELCDQNMKGNDINNQNQLQSSTSRDASVDIAQKSSKSLIESKIGNLVVKKKRKTFTRSKSSVNNQPLLQDQQKKQSLQVSNFTQLNSPTSQPQLTRKRSRRQKTLQQIKIQENEHEHGKETEEKSMFAENNDPNHYATDRRINLQDSPSFCENDKLNLKADNIIDINNNMNSDIDKKKKLDKPYQSLQVMKLNSNSNLDNNNFNDEKKSNGDIIQEQDNESEINTQALDTNMANSIGKVFEKQLIRGNSSKFYFSSGEQKIDFEDDKGQMKESQGNQKQKGDFLNKKKSSTFNSQRGKRNSIFQMAQIKLRSIWEGLFRIHSFFGIFLVFDKDLNRPKRFLLYYLRIHLLLAVTAMFSQAMTQYQAVIFSIISAIFLGIPIAIISKLFKSKKQCAQIIGLIIFFTIYLTSVYAILTTAALMGIKKANEWAESYFLSFSLDSFMIETLMNMMKLHLIKSELVNGGSMFQKIFGNPDIIDYFQDIN